MKNIKYLNNLLNLPRTVKTLIAISIDFSCCVISVWFAYYLRLGSFVSLSERGLEALVYALIISFPIFIFLGLYKNIFRYSGLDSLFNVSKALLIYGIIYGTRLSLFGIKGIPRTIGLIQPLILLFLILSWRVLVRFILRNINNQHYAKKDLVKALVYGSGEAGRQLVKAMQDSQDISIQGFIDDDKSKRGCVIDGKKIYSINDLGNLVNKKNISLILLAIPSISRKKRNEIIKNLLNYKIAVRTIPNISNLASGKNLITEFSDLDVDDLLGRIEVEPFQSLMNKNNFEKTILVTGAGGSIGSELCRQILKQHPSKILLVEISEYALYSIHSELDEVNKENIEIIPLIGSVQDKQRMEKILSIFKPTTIYHAAAYKHVPIVEHNLIEGLKNNLLGTFDLAQLALSNNVSNFVFISTDKAVRPTSIMGATKRLAELSLQALNEKNLGLSDEQNRTKFAIVRFGNVLDSSGSVIPKFRDQIRNGGPITLTDREITRYFMTITEAAQLVIQAGAMAKGGEVFVLDMGNPIKIYDLAKRMIELSGLSIKSHTNPNGDIEIKITGLRPGEKLYEELLLSKNPIKTKHPKVFRSNEPFIVHNELIKEINNLKELIEKNDLENILNNLKRIVIDYYPNKNIIDHTFMRK
jgi:FlaA1/EpsC-like NDP-sugar epimerase